MATYYPITQGGNWSAAGTWNTAPNQHTGNAPNAPLASDDIVFDSHADHEVAIDTATCVCKTLTCQDPGNAIAFTAGQILTVSGSVTFCAGMTLTGTGTLKIAAAATLTSNGNTFPGSINFAYIGTITLADALTLTDLLAISASATMAGNFNISCGSFRQDSGTELILIAGRTLTIANGLSLNGVDDAWATNLKSSSQTVKANLIYNGTVANCKVFAVTFGNIAYSGAIVTNLDAWYGATLSCTGITVRTSQDILDKDATIAEQIETIADRDATILADEATIEDLTALERRSVEADHLNFNAIVGGSNPAAQIFCIYNQNLESLDWTSDSSQAWASILPESGSIASGGNSPITVSIDTTGLNAGTHTAIITITDELDATYTINITLVMTDPPASPAQPTLTSLVRTGATGVAVVGNVPSLAWAIVWGRPFFNSNLKVELGRELNTELTTAAVAVALDFSDFHKNFFGWFDFDLPCLVEAVVLDGAVYSLPTLKALPILFGSGGNLTVTGERDPADPTKINFIAAGAGAADRVVAMNIKPTSSIAGGEMIVGNGPFVASGMNPDWKYQIDFFQITPEGSIVAIVGWVEEQGGLSAGSRIASQFLPRPGTRRVL